MEAKDPYENLKKELNKIGNWPQVYMFKFIVRADTKFTDESIKTRQESANGKYISITVKEVMLSADSIIDKYKEMEGIEGLMAFWERSIREDLRE